jgi:hypothetical protein
MTAKPDEFVDEPDEWAAMTPQERWAESAKLWELYLAMGGSLDPEPDSQSPFDFEEMQRAIPPVRRASLHPVRRD